MKAKDLFSLQDHSYNLTQLMRQGTFSHLKGYEAVIARIFKEKRKETVTDRCRDTVERALTKEGR